MPLRQSVGGESVNGNIIKRPRDRITKGITKLILSINIQIPADILKMMRYSLLKTDHMMHNMLLLYFVDTLLTN